MERNLYHVHAGRSLFIGTYCISTTLETETERYSLATRPQRMTQFPSMYANSSSGKNIEIPETPLRERRPALKTVKTYVTPRDCKSRPNKLSHIYCSCFSARWHSKETRRAKLDKTSLGRPRRPRQYGQPLGNRKKKREREGEREILYPGSTWHQARESSRKTRRACTYVCIACKHFARQLRDIARDHSSSNACASAVG